MPTDPNPRPEPNPRPRPGPPDDRTARARIRDAALAAFAEHGTRGATMRGIAEAAGVSVGLVQHHFGTKDGLRAACDEAVVDLFRRQVSAAGLGAELSGPGGLGALLAAGPAAARYLARAMADGSAAADGLLDELTDGAEDFLSATWPDRFPAGSARARDAAAALAAMHGGTLVLHAHLARRMGADPLDGTDPGRLGRAIIDVHRALGEFAASPTGAAIADSLGTGPDPGPDTDTAPAPKEPGRG
ncbi:TetR/AcrR family transcriptional regulator [Streptomonospora mangrovi]|uniref:TetR/AcrR family transcriptional regulator n=1 Tax=Streptomonospora mangrovi TaxID=2883123 RepID=UPI0022DD79E5|nr:helix-turn-helix domain-containing protein [Streptomonospora mangrovi]